MLIYK